MWCLCCIKRGDLCRTRYHMSVLLTADIRLSQAFPSHEDSSLDCARATVQEAMTYWRSKMRAARSDRGCAAPNHRTKVSHDVVAISAGRTMPASHGAATGRSPTVA